MAFKYTQAAARLYLPQANSIVLAPGKCMLSVRLPGYTKDVADVAFEHPQAATRLDLP
jgi:hypothetical protein